MVVIRLSRAGTKKRPFYHLVVSDKRSKRDGKYIERLGFFNPIAKGQEVPIQIDIERYNYWRSVGAQPSGRTSVLYKRFVTQTPSNPNIATNIVNELEQSTNEPEQGTNEPEQGTNEPEQSTEDSQTVTKEEN